MSLLSILRYPDPRLHTIARAVADVDERIRRLVDDMLDTMYANDGVGLAPYHDFDSKIDAGLKAEVEQLKADIISGKIKVISPAQPK